MKFLLASVPARAKSVLERSWKKVMIDDGSRFVKRSPTFPTKWGERREVFGWYSEEGSLPRALAITFVFPKKSLQ